MTDADRELVELAAKAYGIKVKGWRNEKLIGFDTNTEREVCGDWNPLESDGDAFRLLIGMQASITPCCGLTYIDAAGNLEFTHIHSENETARAGARRAITRAAAEIGRGMK